MADIEIVVTFEDDPIGVDLVTGGAQGPAGPPGEQGEQGEQGLQGEPGEAGSHPDLATHDALGLATDVALAAGLAGKADVHAHPYEASGAVATEAAARAAADTTLTTAVTNEAAARAAADTALAAGTTAHIGMTPDAHDAAAISFVPAAGVASGNVQAAVEEVAGNVTSEAATRAAADTALSTAIANETTARVAADAAKADLVGGKIPSSQLPAIATGEHVTVANEAARLALTSGQVQPGDVATQTDEATRWLLLDTDPSLAGSWLQLTHPADAVTSVNGETGVVVLSADDVGALEAADIGVTVQAHAAVLDATTASFTAAKDTKLDGIEAGADVTDAGNVDAAGAVMNADASTAAMAFVVDEDDMVSDSATKVPTQQSVKAYVAAQTGTSLTVHEAASNPHPGYLTPAEGDAAYSAAGHTHDTFTEAEHDSRDHSAAMSGVLLADLSDGDNVKGFADARADIDLARPTGYASIEWLAEDEPTNWVDGDSLIVVAP